MTKSFHNALFGVLLMVCFATFGLGLAIGIIWAIQDNWSAICAFWVQSTIPVRLMEISVIGFFVVLVAGFSCEPKS